MTTEKEISIWVKVLLLIIEEGNGKNQKTALKKLAAILKAKKKSYLLQKILKKTETAYKKAHLVEVFLAKGHSPEISKRILEKLPDHKGKTVRTKEEGSLIGGFRAKTSSSFLKASVKDLLDELKNKIISQSL